MAISTLTLAKRIKATVKGHQALVERDGTQDIPQGMNFNFGGELQTAGEKLRNHIHLAYETLSSQHSFTVPEVGDESREASVARNLIYAVRCLYTLKNSPQGILRTTFQDRTYDEDDLNECIPLGLDQLSKLADYSCVFQFKRHAADENNPWVFSWLLAVEGVVISRGARQPINKFVTSLLKLTTDELLNHPSIQLQIAELAKMKGASVPYYWYLSNKHTTMYYHAFREHLNLDSCMAKDHSFYEHAGARQHPMDCYDNSPDWSLMLISKQSPEEIIAACDLVIANPDTVSFDFPFLSRCLVLPASKETSGRSFTAPYVFGKFYGNDKLVNFFYSTGMSSDGSEEMNNNGLLECTPKIDGGRIPVIHSTSHDGIRLLPYFDRHNKANLVKDGDKEWWVSVGTNMNVSGAIAKCTYLYGSALFTSYNSLGYGAKYNIDSFQLNTFKTIFGEDVEEFRHAYTNQNFNGVDIAIPNSMFVDAEGTRALPGVVTGLYDGTKVLTATVANNPKRFKLVNQLGIFDMDNPKHASLYARFEETAPATEEAV